MISSNCHAGKEEGGEWNDAGPVLEAPICCSLHTMFIGRFHKLGPQFQIGLSDSKPQTEPIHVSRTGLVAAAAEGEGGRPIPIVSCHRVMLEIRDRAQTSEREQCWAGRQAGAAVWNDDCRRI